MFVYGPYEKNSMKGIALYFVEWLFITLNVTLAVYMMTGELSMLASSMIAAGTSILFLIIVVLGKIIGEEKFRSPIFHRIIGVLILVCGIVIIPFSFNGFMSAATDVLTGVAPTSAWAAVCGAVTIITISVCERKGTQLMKLFSPLIGALAGCALAAIITVVGSSAGDSNLIIVDFSVIDSTDILSQLQPTFSGAIEQIGSMSAYNIIPCAAYALAVIFMIIELNDDEKIETGRRSTKLGNATRGVLVIAATAIQVLIMSIGFIAVLFGAIPTCVLAGAAIGTAVIAIVTGFDSLTNKG